MMRRSVFDLIGVIFFTITCFAAEIEKPMVVIVPSYNNAQWYKKNLDSIFSQKYSNFRVIYVDACSTDGTYDLVSKYVVEHKETHRCTVIRNKSRCRPMANWYRAIHSCDDCEIVISVDGDDWLKHDRVLSVVNSAYSDPNVWLTYGQFEHFPSKTIGFCRPFPSGIRQNRDYRKYEWLSSHLRTFYAGLFKKVKLVDFLYGSDFFSVAGDCAIMFPMLEMAGEKYKCLHEILYVYNTRNPLSEFRVYSREQALCANLIRAQKKYPELKSFEDLKHKKETVADVILITSNNKNVEQDFVRLREIIEGVNQIFIVHEDPVAGCFTDNMKGALGKVVTSCVLVVKDGKILNNKINLGELTEWLLRTQAHFFALTVGKSLSTCPPEMAYLSENKVFAWRLSHGRGIWHHQFPLSAELYVTKELLNAFKGCAAKNYAELVSSLNKEKLDDDFVGLCFQGPLLSEGKA